MNTITIRRRAVQRPVARPLPPEPAIDGEVMPRRVRVGSVCGATYDWMRPSEYDYDAAEARSGLIGHSA